ncbi:DUF3892 domain-containing protein [Demequina sp. TTPB684]|uniref:DUF3892 domain-containing protein n=1 Tax=unclassified Demequina TaxID=2620311 RepID=UPI001CF1E02E|nr:MULTISPECIES: DUF3892 domain-containing protein [unclassified Demequina]MCB2412293.1 DUF3892 domain-containing protein [Demequina sp. TTPB684]UPU87573.1 DUF3892 domain-containing protein [Demequina sp. TMPB413]
MSIEITHVRFGSTAASHETITAYKWRNDQTGHVGSSDKPAMVAWVDIESNVAHVGQGDKYVAVGAVHPTSGEAHLRTHADGQWTNNLLSLPTY